MRSASKRPKRRSKGRHVGAVLKTRSPLGKGLTCRVFKRPRRARRSGDPARPSRRRRRVSWLPGGSPRPRAAVGVYTAVMSEDARPGDDEAQHEDSRALPRHLSALIGSLRGPADLGRNHDKYLTYADREEAGGVASA